MLLASSRGAAPGRDGAGGARAPSRRSSPPPDTPELLAAEIQVDPLGLELAPDLIDLVDTASGGDLLDRVKALRRKIAGELGIVVPPVRTRDNLDLPPRTYAIQLFGVEVARGRGAAGHRAGHRRQPRRAARRARPASRSSAWRRSGSRPSCGVQAELSGATVVDRASVITTHLAEVVGQHAGRLLGREDVKMLTDMVKRSHPVVVEELTPAQLSLGEVQRVLQGLLDEQVSVRDLVRIFEALSLKAPGTKDPDALVEAARAALGPAIVAPHLADGAVHVISFEPTLEQRMLEAVRDRASRAVIALDPLSARACSARSPTCGPRRRTGTAAGGRLRTAAALRRTPHGAAGAPDHRRALLHRAHGRDTGALGRHRHR